MVIFIPSEILGTHAAAHVTCDLIVLVLFILYAKSILDNLSGHLVTICVKTSTDNKCIWLPL